MAKASFVCPHCHKVVKDLKGHIARLHAQSPKTPAPVKAKTLELAVKKTEPKKEVTAQGYHCIDCGSPLAKGQAPCPCCGNTPDWGAV